MEPPGFLRSRGYADVLAVRPGGRGGAAADVVAVVLWIDRSLILAVVEPHGEGCEHGDHRRGGEEGPGDFAARRCGGHELAGGGDEVGDRVQADDGLEPAGGGGGV